MWLTDFRRKHGLQLYELAGLIRMVGSRKVPALTVSEGLIWRLEVDGNFRTVPKLADLIAECCGATAQQRDRLVLDAYKGTWTPARHSAPKLPEREVKPRYKCGQERPVVVIDQEGNEIRRHPSAKHAARWVGISGDSVNRRCNRATGVDEFNLCRVSFRWADEYDRMPPEARRRDAGRTRQRKNAGTHVRIPGKRGRGGATYVCPVTAIMPNGEARRFPSVNAAAKGLGVGASTVYKNLHRGRPAQAGPMRGITLFYTAKAEIQN